MPALHEYDSQKRSYIFRLTGSAVMICRVWGKETKREDEYYFDSDDNTLHSYPKISYVYRDEKLPIKVTDGRKSEKDYKVKIIINSIQSVVFDYFVENLFTYRPGKWEKYLLSLSEDAAQIIRQQKQRQMELYALRFEPIDDSNIF